MVVMGGMRLAEADPSGELLLSPSRVPLSLLYHSLTSPLSGEDEICSTSVTFTVANTEVRRAAASVANSL